MLAHALGGQRAVAVGDGFGDGCMLVDAAAVDLQRQRLEHAHAAHLARGGDIESIQDAVVRQLGQRQMELVADGHELEPGLAALHAVQNGKQPADLLLRRGLRGHLRQLWLENIARLHQLAQRSGVGHDPGQRLRLQQRRRPLGHERAGADARAQEARDLQALDGLADGAAADVKELCQLDLRRDLRAGRPGLRADVVEHALGHVLVELGPLDRLTHSPIMSNTGGCAPAACSFSSSTPASATSSMPVPMICA